MVEVQGGRNFSLVVGSKRRKGRERERERERESGISFKAHSAHGPLGDIQEPNHKSI
jgi:hypothetical protein